MSSKKIDIKLASPKVRKFARELGANISNVEGSQRSGRVTEEDVKQFIKSQVSVDRGQVIPKKYKDAHNAVCEHYGLTPSNTVHIATAPMTKEWEMFQRDRQYHRVNIRDAVKRYKKSGTFND